MQTRAQSTLEVFIDFVFSILVNVGGQLLIYGTAATTTHVTFFSSIFLILVFVRRFVTRRFFEALTSPGAHQSRSQSALEAVSDTIVTNGVSLLQTNRTRWPYCHGHALPPSW